MILLLACAPKEPPRVAEDMAAPVVEAEPAPPPPPPGSWRTGWWPDPAVYESPGEAWSRMLPGPVTEPLATDGDRLYVVAEGRVYAMDADGNPLWNVRPLATGGVSVTAMGPAVGSESGNVVFLDPKDGATVRSALAGGPVRGEPVQLDTSVAWVTVHGAVASTASWGHDVAASAAGRPVADGEQVFITTLEGELVCADASGVRWKAVLPGTAADGPTLDAEHVYVPIAAATGHPGGVVAFDRAGKELWRHQTEFGPAAPLSVGAAVYVADRDGHVYALDPASGKEIWSAEGFSEFTSQPLLLGDQIYVGNGDGFLYRIDSDGGVVWKTRLGAPLTGDPVMLRGRIVLGLANGRVVALGG